MGLRAALGLSAAAPKLRSDKGLSRRKILNCREIPLKRTINIIRAETKFHFKMQVLGEIPSHRKPKCPSMQNFTARNFTILSATKFGVKFCPFGRRWNFAAAVYK